MQKNKGMKILLVVFLVTFFIDSKMAFAELSICNPDKQSNKIITELMGYVKIFIPILLIVLGTTDFVKAMVAQDEQQMKKAQATFVKRLIIGVVIFFVPMIMQFLFKIAGMDDSCLYNLIKF